MRGESAYNSRQNSKFHTLFEMLVSLHAQEC
jgi:hypothetical protein